MRKLKPSVIWLIAAIGGCTNGWVADALAQSYPVRPIHLIVGYSPGGGTDVTARLLAQKLSENLDQSVVVENRPGASGMVALEKVIKSSPDGYTLLLMTSNDTIVPALRSIPYDLERDMAPVSLVATGPLMVLVNPALPAHSIEELIALARKEPGKLSFGSPGLGTSPHLAGVLFNSMAGVNIVHVPYRGSAESVLATAAGQIDMSFASVTSALPLLDAGKAKPDAVKVTPLAVTSAKRASSAPSVPTLDEAGLPGFDLFSWYGVVGPVGISKEILARLNAAIGKVVNTPEMKDAFNKQGLEAQTDTLEQFTAFIHSEIVRNAKLIKSSEVNTK